jgi:long-chain acyl-CoA synthetase
MSSAHQSVHGALAGKNVLLTGVTGFLGKVFLAFVLEEGLFEGGRITLLVRGKKGKPSAQRLAALFARSPAFRRLRAEHGAKLGPWLAERIDVVDGEAREPGLGIDPGKRATLEARTDVVIHVAGLTDFNPDPTEAIAVNVHGALAAAALAQQTRGKRLMHISTCFVAGGIDGPALEHIQLDEHGGARSPNGTRFDPEDELLAIESVCRAQSQRHTDIVDAKKARIEAGSLRARALGWPNLYTYTKALAEILIASRQRRERHPCHVSMFRPSIIECARTFPFQGWNEGVNTAAPLVWLTGTLHRRMPFNPDHTFDVVPVDDVARGMVVSLASLVREDAPVLDVVQVATGDHNPIAYGRALDLVALTRRRQFAKSPDPLERMVLQHLDSVIWDVPADEDPVLPAIRTGARAARDLLIGFDPEMHLPKSMRQMFGSKLSAFAKKAGKELGQASRTVGQVMEMLRAYQPFTFDHDPTFITERVRAMSAALGDDDRARFGVETHTIDWRDYWMNVEVPGLERWSLPILRGERVLDDEPVPLTCDLPLVEASETTPHSVAYAGDAE